jgi:hypothetical protein
MVLVARRDRALRFGPKACRDPSDALGTLQASVFSHVFMPKPIPTFGMHA